MTPNGGCMPLSDLLLRGQVIALGTGRVRQESSSKVGNFDSHLWNRRDRPHLLGV